MSTGAIDALCRLEHSTNLAKRESFLGLSTLLHIFVPNDARVAALQIKTLQKGQRKTVDELSYDKINILKKLKANLLEPSILAFSRLQATYTIDRDPCNNTIGSAELQRQLIGTNRPLKSWVRSLNDEKQAYDTRHRTCFAVVWTMLVLITYHKGF